MKERADELIQLYSQYRHEARKHNRWFLPCRVLTFSNMIAVTTGMSWLVFGNSPEYLQYYFQNALVPEISSMTATALLPLIGKRRQEAVIKEVTLKIAEIEDRVPTNYKEELQRVGFISYGLTHLLHEPPFNKMSHLNDRQHWVRQQFQALADQHINIDFILFDKSTKTNGNLRKTSLELGEYYWDEIARDKQQPDYRRIYAYKKLAAIRQRLHL